MILNYQETCEDLLQGLSGRTREIIVRRFGLRKNERATLQTIGDDYGITRERVRQIEKVGISKISPLAKKCAHIFQFFSNQLQISGRIRREEVLLKILGPESFKNHIFFLLNLIDEFKRVSETDDFYSFWTMDKTVFEKGQEVLKVVLKKVENRGEPIGIRELERFVNLRPDSLLSFLEISKLIAKGPQGLWGLSSWSQISPRCTGDRAYVILKKIGSPLHFREISRLINELDIFDSGQGANSQTVHNELIKNSQFVLVGRGIYALREWGYKEGTVKDVIIRILEKNKKPLTKKRIIEEVLRCRLVKKDTILLNLRNEKYFIKDSQGRYALRKA